MQDAERFYHLADTLATANSRNDAVDVKAILLYQQE